MAFRILIIDDDSTALETARLNLASEPDLIIETTTEWQEGVKAVKAAPFAYAVVLVDLRMPGMNGLDVTSALLKINPRLIVAMSSGDYSREALKESFGAGAADFIEKDTAPDLFRQKIRAFCKKFEETCQTFVGEDAEDKNALDIATIGMVGRSQAMAEIAQLVRQASPTDASVLIFGESGTGKELIARAVHRLSNRRQKPFIAVNVAAIPENLLESDLFGHEKGSFTGADQRKIGKFKLADGGTLFLDEIGEMKLELQAKLLRVLQEGEINPVGATAPTKVNVRIVAATHVDLERAVQERRFREDLYYRLNVLKLCIPPLRDRPQDIQPLVRHFQRKFDGEHKSLSMKTIRYMERYPWRGNIRELENEMEKLMTIIPATRIEPEHLSSKIFADQTSRNENEFDCTYAEFMEKLRAKERQYIESHLAKGSIREVTKNRMRAPLGTIYGRMQKLGIQKL